eukprot:SAG31_NODE_8061_length_1530_cov_29.254758_1_plen_159_part_01
MCGGTDGRGRVEVGADFTAEYSWFPPHRWAMAGCSCCRAHLGWAFSSPEVSAPVFLGLIVTRLRQRTVPAEALLQRPSETANEPTLRAAQAMLQAVVAGGSNPAGAMLGRLLARLTGARGDFGSSDGEDSDAEMEQLAMARESSDTDNGQSDEPEGEGW